MSSLAILVSKVSKLVSKAVNLRKCVSIELFQVSVKAESFQFFGYPEFLLLCISSKLVRFRCKLVSNLRDEDDGLL